MANEPQIVNVFGEMTGWRNVTMTIMGREIVGIKRIAYSDTIPIEPAYGASDMPVGAEAGNYKAECTIELYHEEYRALLLSLKPGTRIQKIPFFDGIVQYEHPSTGIIQTDRLKNLKFQDLGVDVKQGDGSISREFKMYISHIDWNTI